MALTTGADGLHDVEHAEALEQAPARGRRSAERERTASEQRGDVRIEHEHGAGPIDARHVRQIDFDLCRCGAEGAQ